MKDEFATRIRRFLLTHGVRRSGTHSEYEHGKQVLLDLGLKPDEYYRAITVLARWVGV